MTKPKPGSERPKPSPTAPTLRRSLRFARSLCPLSAPTDQGGRATAWLLACLSKLTKVNLTDILPGVWKVNRILFFFFPPSWKKRLWKASAWAITFSRSVLWPLISSQPVQGDSLHITRAISSHSDATEVLHITVVLMHESLAATHDMQGGKCTPREEALEVRHCLTPKHSCFQCSYAMQKKVQKRG